MKFKWIFQVEEKVKHAVCPLPKHVIHRIHELAAIHPYPRKRISKFSYTSQVTSPTLPLIPKGYPLSLHGRNVRRKNLPWAVHIHVSRSVEGSGRRRPFFSLEHGCKFCFFSFSSMPCLRGTQRFYVRSNCCLE
ncbi:uncharacterized protein LOC110811247 [Carica papaya]|uniref:uncharacterized protein LOC110811247 n=1 Tax=Carica papaya TaxID=3649 RepID=UPI000B8D06EC|nr:uncharacterized protein LOC110811247 [Carica papaya]